MLKAPAKLNLTLEVLQRRPDGFHLIRSVMVPIELFDEITIERRPGPLVVHCSDPALERDNIVERALTALELDADLQIFLRKSIPVGAGMGGGSSDAASILIAAQDGGFGKLRAVDYLALARRLGSDVPFFLTKTGALVEGSGERVTPAGSLPDWHAVIVQPPVAVSTAQAYAALDDSTRTIRPRNTSMGLDALSALQRRDFERVTELLHNDFEEVVKARVPEIATALDSLRAAGARKPIVTGSGSCVFALAADREDARAVTAALVVPPGYRVYEAAFARADSWRPTVCA
ncbi:MAG: 4-(cytidine 5'-diphospho)-2-C-methyl-D-erythritol kinase [Candidatus Eremiobacteraeota bacterium]|nr:4-(cytidine 5'-diphospho)-2-C-methyl-D-erythritol kinase [Candidatus Eremiobacteraeota bacterium]